MERFAYAHLSTNGHLGRYKTSLLVCVRHTFLLCQCHFRSDVVILPIIGQQR